MKIQEIIAWTGIAVAIVLTLQRLDYPLNCRYWEESSLICSNGKIFNITESGDSK